MRNRLALVCIALLLGPTPALASERTENSAGLQLAETGQIQLAQAGVTSRTRNSIRFAPGYELRIERRGRESVAKIIPPGGNAQSGGYVSCFCQTENGASGGCSLKLHNGLNCSPTGSGTCSGSCTIKLTAPPPPAPNP